MPPTTRSITAITNAKNQYIVSNLDKSQLETIKTYVVYGPSLNYHIREKYNQEELEFALQIANELAEIIKQVEPNTIPFTVWRGSHGGGCNIMQFLKAGETFSFKGLLATSFSKETAISFALGREGLSRDDSASMCLYQIDIPIQMRGLNIWHILKTNDFVSSSYDYNEILFPLNCVFRFVSKHNESIEGNLIKIYRIEMIAQPICLKVYDL